MADLLERLKTALTDRYRVEREIGRGGMAHVFLAQDLKLDRPVALKVLRPELAAVLGGERFLREITLAAKLEHPHILGIYDSGDADGILYYTMPYVEGESLRGRLAREKQLSLEDALQISREVADALSYAHARGVVHRDIKPENILLGAGHAVVADFGIARAIDAAGGERLTETGVALGTPPYMSPEQAGGSRDLDGRSDLYSLGCVLYEMLAGQPPFVGPTTESVVVQHLTVPPPDVTTLRPSVPSWVAAALRRSLAKTPADRFNPVAQFGEAIAPRVPVAETTPAPTPPRPWPVRWLVTAAAALVVAVGGWYGWRGLGSGDATITPVGPPPYVIVADAQGNADPEVRETVGALFALALDGSGAVRPLTDGQIRQALAAAGRADTTSLDVDLASELAVRGGFRPVIVPTVEAVGATYVVAARVLDARDGTLLASARQTASGSDELIDATDAVVHEVVTALASSDVQLSGASLQQIATPSFEAWQLYVGQVGQPVPERLRQLREVLRRDPGFAVAWRRLALVYLNMGEVDSARAAMAEALRHEDRFTPAQRLDAEGALAFIDWDMAAAFRVYDRLWKAHGVLDDNLTYALWYLGRWEDALDFQNELIARSPYGPSDRALETRFSALLMLDRPDEALASRPSLARWHYEAYHLVSAQWSALDSVAALIEADATVPLESQRGAAAARASAFAASGRVRAAEEALDRIIAEAYEQDAPLRDIRGYETAQLLLGMVSDRPIRAARAETAGDTNAAAWTHRALQAALTGDTVTARDLLSRVAALPHKDRALLGAAPRVAEAAAAWVGSRWDAVPPLIGTAAAWVWPARPSLGLDYAGVCRVLLADAHERLGQPDSAVVYLQLLATPAEMYKADDLWGAGLAYSFAHFRLGKLYTDLAQYDRAEEHYLTFLQTFTQPDPEYQSMVDEAGAALEELARGR